ncbi:MAG TPA: BTAD domain-containing putative transcriptional regulator [Gaiellaceae bacterium]|nr:BTAD domain-containing putative transcriptional regulator [Gaiellaceae bacterium]
MEFRILGPLEVVEDGNPVALGTLKERLVLGVLLLHANEFVSRERLIDDLWGAAPPATARKAVNVYISKLRQALTRDGHDPIATADGGYRLLVDSDLLDADRMRGLVARAAVHMADGESEAASQLLQEALAFWRGPTLAGLSLESFGRDEVAQLDELRLTVLMDRIDCDLAQGRHERVLGELQVLVREHPLRERLRAQQMLALYRADRQAEALEAYQRARHDLIEELGIEPSESLQRLHQAILRHDPALEVPSGTAASNGAVTASVPTADVTPPRRQAFRRRQLVVAALAAGAAVAALVALLSTVGGGREALRASLPVIKPNSLARIDPVSGTLVSDVPAAGIEPGPMALTGSKLWLVNRGAGTISRYLLPRDRPTTTFSAGSTPYAVAADPDGNAWVSNTSPTVTWILHTATGSGTAAVPLVAEPIPVPLPRAGAEAYGGGYLWVIPGPLTGRSGYDRVSLIGVRSHRVAQTIRVGGETTAIAYGFGSAWIGTYDARHSSAFLSIVGPGSNRARPLKLETDDGWGPLAIAVGDGDVWVLTSAGSVIRVDPETLKIVGRVRLSAKHPALLAVGAGYVWTVNLADHSLSQIAPHTNKVVRTVPLGSFTSTPCGIAATHDAVWVTVGDAYCANSNAGGV